MQNFVFVFDFLFFQMSKEKGTFGSNSRNDPLERSKHQNPDSGLVSRSCASSESESGPSEQLESKDKGTTNSKHNQRQT
jgi:hypothetical protein